VTNTALRLRCETSCATLSGHGMSATAEFLLKYKYVLAICQRTLIVLERLAASINQMGLLKLWFDVSNEGIAQAINGASWWVVFLVMR